MRLALRRFDFQKTRTIGRLSIDGVHECFVLEDVARKAGDAKVPGATAIPVGTYRVVAEDSPKFGRDTLTLVAVPGFKFIRIHSGNTEGDTEGCPVVGKTVEDWDATQPGTEAVGRSIAALADLKAKVLPALRRGEECWIDVTEE